MEMGKKSKGEREKIKEKIGEGEKGAWGRRKLLCRIKRWLCRLT